jgi:DNA-binding NtrC family response regulator
VIGNDSLAAMKLRPWRDNVLELNAVLEEATRRSRTTTIDLSATFLDEVEKVQEGVRTLQVAKPIRLEELLGSVEKALIQRTMARCKSNIGKTARLLGLTEQNLRYRIRKYGLFIPQLRKRK